MEICIALVCTAWVLRYHYRNPAMGKIPKWIRVSISLFSFTSVPVYFLCVYMCLRVCFLLFACIYFNISVFVYLTVSVSVFLCISFSVYTRLCVCRCHCNCMHVSCMAHSYCYPCPRLCSCPLPGCWRYGGWHTCLSRDPGSIPAQCSYQIKIPPWSHVRRVFPV